MPLVLIEALISLGMMFLKWVLSLNEKHSKELENFKRFAELARTENIKTIQDRARAEDQLQSANDKWDQKENEAKK